MDIVQPVGMFDNDTGLWKLTEEWSVELASGKKLTLHPGFLSDGASIPRMLWPLVGPGLSFDTFPAALVHDALYASELVDRKTADYEFHRILVECGVGTHRAWAYWWAVRTFGGWVWKTHDLNSVYENRQFVSLEGADV